MSAERRSARKPGRRGETSVFLGIGLQIAATFLFTLMGAQIRYLGDRIPLGEVIFARSFLAFIPLLAMLIWRREIASAVRMKQPWSHIWRAVTGVASMFFMFAGLALIPLADATAITFATPLLSVVLAAIFLKEIVRVWRWSAVVVGLIGVLIMISPHLGASPRDTASAYGALYMLDRRFPRRGGDDAGAPARHDREHRLDRVLVRGDLVARGARDAAAGLARAYARRRRGADRRSACSAASGKFC